MRYDIDELRAMIEEAAKDWLMEYVKGSSRFDGMLTLQSDVDDGWQYGKFRVQYDTGYVEFEAKVYAEYSKGDEDTVAHGDTLDVWNIKGYSVDDVIDNDIEARHE